MFHQDLINPFMETSLSFQISFTSPFTVSDQSRSSKFSREQYGEGKYVLNRWKAKEAKHLVILALTSCAFHYFWKFSSEITVSDNNIWFFPHPLFPFQEGLTIQLISSHFSQLIIIWICLAIILLIIMWPFCMHLLILITGKH